MRHPGFAARERMYDAVLPADARPGVIVDVGGIYDSVSWLRERFPEARLIATNVREEDLDPIPSELAETRLCRAEELDDLGEVDMIFLGEVLEHLVYPNEFLEAAVRALRPSGLLLLSTPNLASWHNRLLMLAGYSPSNYSMMPGRHLGVPGKIANRVGNGYGDHIRVFTYRALKQLFSQSPWELVDIAGTVVLGHDRPFARTRAFVARALPQDARESVFVCARLVSKEVEQVTSIGFIGSSYSPA